MKFFIGNKDKEFLSSSISRKKFMEYATNLYLIPSSLNFKGFTVYETFPFNTYRDIAIVIGHNIDVINFVNLFCNLLTETRIYIIACNINLNLDGISIEKKVFLSNQKDNKVSLRDGRAFNLDFNVTDTELYLHNDHARDFEKSLEENFKIIKRGSH